MNYTPRTTPVEAEPFSKDRKGQLEVKPDLEEQHDFATLSSILGALVSNAFRTRPGISWAVTRVSRA
eukprot:7657763-Prorocentrum_lima.AAC.1